MKEFFSSILVLIGAVIVTVLMWSIGFLYSIGYSIWLTVTLKEPLAFFKFWWRVIDGIFFAIGNVIFQIAYSLDLTWNVYGEIIEDLVTAEEHTTFTDRDMTVSSSVGKLEVDGKLNKFGIKFSEFLNIVFGQKRHAVDSWYYAKAKKDLKSNYFTKRKDK
jgi:hypothetical protein